MKTISTLLMGLVLAAGVPMSASAAEHEHEHNHADPKAAAPNAAVALTDGEIKKIDKAAGKITIKHGALANLEMGPMTMVFRVKDKAMLEQFQGGDKVKFSAEKVNRVLTVTTMQADK